MIVLDDPPVAVAATPAPRSTVDATAATPGWRFAARLARREVRRRPGRTALVMLLVALPVAALALASIAVRSTADQRGDSYRRQYGAADLVVTTGNTAGSQPVVPEGVRAIDFLDVYAPIIAETSGGLVVDLSYVHLLDLDLRDPMAAGIVRLVAGDVPERAGEVLLTPSVAEDLGVAVGDTVRLVRPNLELLVTGIGRESAWLDQRSMFIADFDRGLLRAGVGSIATMIDVPASFSRQQIDTLIADYRMGGYFSQSAANQQFVDRDSVDARTLAWGWVAGVLAFVAVGVVIAAAFATTARRQLVTIGQLSSNGASARLIRRVLALQGMWTGLLGAAVGLSAAIAIALPNRRLFELMASHSVGAVRVAPSDMLVIGATAVVAATLAALIPARSAARTPVLSALAGRRPIAPPRARLVPIGVGSFLVGLVLIGAASGSQRPDDLIAAVAILGGLLVLASVVCIAPLIIAFVGVVGRRLGVVMRLSARSLGRAQTRSAAVVTAIATISAMAIAGLTITASVRAQNQFTDADVDHSNFVLEYEQDPYANAVFDEFGNIADDFVPDVRVPSPLPDELRRNIETLLPDAELSPISSVTTSLGVHPRFATPETDPGPTIVPDPIVADEFVTGLFGLTARERSHLDAHGIVSIVPWISGPAQLQTADGLVPVDLGAGGEAFGANLSARFSGVLISPQLVDELGLDTAVTRWFVDNPVELNDDERSLLRRFQRTCCDDVFTAEAGGNESFDAAAGQWYVGVWQPQGTRSWVVIQSLVLGAALLLVLAVVAIGLSLAATESQDERDVLYAMGAAPKTLRRVAAAKAWILTTGAAVIAVPAGYLVIRVVTSATNETAPFPFVGAIALLAGVPLVAALAALAASSAAQRVRPVRVSATWQE